MNKVNINEKLSLFNDFWNPKIVGDLNDTHIKLVKLKGEFVWHKHENEDEMFLVIKGKLEIKMRDRNIILTEGEFFVIPKNTDHLPIAEEEVHVLLIEPKNVLNTGNINNERTVSKLEYI